MIQEQRLRSNIFSERLDKVQLLHLLISNF